MIEFIVAFIGFFIAYGCGIWSHHRISIDYKERWREAIKLFEQERLGTQELELLDKPRPDTLDRPRPKQLAPKRGLMNSGYRHPDYGLSHHPYQMDNHYGYYGKRLPPVKSPPKAFVKIRRQDPYRALGDSQRYDLELNRLKTGHEPRDAFGGCQAHWWAKGRQMQLQYGWDFFDADKASEQGWKYVK